MCQGISITVFAGKFNAVKLLFTECFFHSLAQFFSDGGKFFSPFSVAHGIVEISGSFKSFKEIKVPEGLGIPSHIVDFAHPFKEVPEAGVFGDVIESVLLVLQHIIKDLVNSRHVIFESLPEITEKQTVTQGDDVGKGEHGDGPQSGISGFGQGKESVNTGFPHEIKGSGSKVVIAPYIVPQHHLDPGIKVPESLFAPRTILVVFVHTQNHGVPGNIVQVEQFTIFA